MSFGHDFLELKKSVGAKYLKALEAPRSHQGATRSTASPDVITAVLGYADIVSGPFSKSRSRQVVTVRSFSMARAPAEECGVVAVT